jgi:hypothetical protein
MVRFVDLRHAVVGEPKVFEEEAGAGISRGCSHHLMAKDPALGTTLGR